MGVPGSAVTGRKVRASRLPDRASQGGVLRPNGAGNAGVSAVAPVIKKAIGKATGEMVAVNQDTGKIVWDVARNR